jgi:hypothetical protein
MKTKHKSILPFNWRNELEHIEAYSIDNDIILLDKPVITSAFQYPFKMDVTTAVICIKGRTEGSIDLKPYISEAPCFINILPDQIMEYKSMSEDFEGLFIIMSQKFADSLIPNAHERLPLHLSVRDNPVITLNEQALQSMMNYSEMMKSALQ